MVKKYAQQKVEFIGQGYPKFKIIILDEVDQMTTFAQQALRRIIEDFSRETRFCLICNYIDKIIAPLNSRCMKFFFRTIPQKHQIELLKQICINEDIQWKSE